MIRSDYIFTKRISRLGADTQNRIYLLLKSTGAEHICYHNGSQHCNDILVSGTAVKVKYK